MQIPEFVESYFDAWNHRDPSGVAAHLAQDGTYCDIPENVKRNHDELIASLAEFFSTYRHRYELIGDVLTNDNTLAFQYAMVATDKTRKTYHGAEFMTLHHDEALTIVDYYDDPGMAESSNLNQTPSDVIQRPDKYAKSGLNNKQLLEYQHRLEHIMSSQHIFLRPDMTLPNLADAVNCSVNHLSQVINSGFGMSFFDYLNQYRIGYAKDLLAQFDRQNGSVLNVAFSVGFNSNSAFYAAFKKCVGQTPAQYRKAQLNKQRH